MDSECKTMARQWYIWKDTFSIFVTVIKPRNNSLVLKEITLSLCSGSCFCVHVSFVHDCTYCSLSKLKIPMVVKRETGVFPTFQVTLPPCPAVHFLPRLSCCFPVVHFPFLSTAKKIAFVAISPASLLFWPWPSHPSRTLALFRWLASADRHKICE